MSFFNELLSSENINELDYKFKVLVLDDCLFMIEGYTKIISLTSNNIILKLSKTKRINVSGNNFCISNLGKREIVVRGQIGGINFD